jgi:Williams-Beuren syndrome DDT (WSD), D-TOX E motif
MKQKQKKTKTATPKLSKAEMKLKKLEEQMDTKKNDIRECEDSVQDVNNDLRETDCQRTKCLGRDRFWNRYYWFERNGMPFSGVPSASTAHYGYANGRLWVQGPDEMERDGFIDVPQEEQDEYKERFGVTLKERHDAEEGDAHLRNASDWGYFDDANSVDTLIAWLDERGVREKALRKELQLWRDVMVECMDKMNVHLGEVDDSSSLPTTRVSTRTKTYVNLEATKWLCLKWSNSMVLEELGMRHSDGIKRRRGAPKKIALDKKGKALKKK